MSPYFQQKGNETSHMLANPEVLEISFISTTCPRATNRIPETEEIVLISQKMTAAAAAAAAAAAVVVVVVVVAAAAAAAAKKIRPTVPAAVAVVGVVAAAAAKKIMRNINPINQEMFRHSQSKAVREFR